MMVRTLFSKRVVIVSDFQIVGVDSWLGHKGRKYRSVELFFDQLKLYLDKPTGSVIVSVEIAPDFRLL